MGTTCRQVIITSSWTRVDLRVTFLTHLQDFYKLRQELLGMRSPFHTAVTSSGGTYKDLLVCARISLATTLMISGLMLGNWFCKVFCRSRVLLVFGEDRVLSHMYKEFTLSLRKPNSSSWLHAVQILEVWKKQCLGNCKSTSWNRCLVGTEFDFARW